MQHITLEQCRAEGVHQGLDERQKVRYLLQGIKCKELEASTAQIHASPTLKFDFDGAVNLCKQFIIHHRDDWCISAVHFGDEEVTIQAVEDQRYTDEEYKKLNPEEIAELDAKQATRNVTTNQVCKQQPEKKGNSLKKHGQHKKQKRDVKAMYARVSQSVASRLIASLSKEDNSSDTEEASAIAKSPLVKNHIKSAMKSILKNGKK